MRNLDSAAENQLNPDVPSPGQELFDETTDDWPKHGSPNGREDDESYSVLLVVGFLIEC
jgi:hypothetical protein